MTKPEPSARNLAAGLIASLLGSVLAIGGSYAAVPPLLFVGLLVAVVGSLITILALHALAQGIDYLVHHADVDVDA